MDEKRKELINIHSETVDSCDSFLDDLRRREALAPAVQRTKEQAQLHAQLLNDAPDEIDPYITVDLLHQAGQMQAHIARSIPTSREIPLAANSMLMASTSTSGVSTMWAFHLVGEHNQTPAVQDFYSAALERQGNLESQRARVADVEALIARLTPTVLDRFQEARGSFERWERGGGGPQDASNNIRTLMYAIQGEWFAEIRLPHEQKNNWSQVAERALPESARVEVTHQAAVYERLAKRELSPIAKQRPGHQDVKRFWRDALDFAFTVLNLLDAHRTSRGLPDKPAGGNADD